MIFALKRTPFLLCWFFLFAVWITNCKPADETKPRLTITSVSPVVAPAGASMTVVGTGFDTNPANNFVLFGTIQAQVVSAKPNQLIIIVPVGGGYGGMSSITVNGVTVDSPTKGIISEPPVVEVTGEITTNTTWRSSSTYLLRGFVYVTNGATLTIEPGTLIRGGSAQQDPVGQSRSGTLIVEPGAKLIANGTGQNPIVFTSNKPVGQRQPGDWGGVVLIGKAPHNRPAATPFEGGFRGTLGNFNEPTDNSGSLQYVRIEFAGGSSAVSSSEPSALICYGVGSGTVLSHIQVSYCGDDGFEWFGGTVNARYLVSFGAFDDDFDTDMGYVGKVQFALALRDPDVADQSGSNCLESDNFAGQGENIDGQPLTLNNGLPMTQPVFANISSFAFAGTPLGYPTLAPKGSGPYQSAMHLRRNTAINVYNSVFVGWPEGLRLDGTTTGTLANAITNRLDLRGIVLANVGNSSTAAVRGALQITNEQAQAYFFQPARQNQLIPLADLPSLLLNNATFTLTAPAFLPRIGSPLLQQAITGGKLTDSFFNQTAYRGAFGTTDWTTGWTNWNPQATVY